MLSGVEKRMLGYIKTNVPKTGAYFSDFYADYSSAFAISEDETAAIWKQLHEKEYVRIKKNQKGSHLGFTLDFRGYFTKDYNRAQFKTFMLKSILVPVMVALIVAFLTALLTYYAISPITRNSEWQFASQPIPQSENQLSTTSRE